MSIASAKTMHLETSAKQMGSHCQEMEKIEKLHSQHQAMHGSAHDMRQDMNCHSDLNDHKDVCPDCIYSSCHSLSSWIDVEISKLTLPEIHALETTFISNYQAKHLAGYWQEILRPPKT
ncbi:hypothetical protein RYU24_16180 [Acinetobacter variabilis]|nr:hypothetical protein RYU24_16180 [Acinetobacter variabilis]